MFRYLRRRLLTAVPTLFGLSIIVFLMVRLVPGDPAVVMAGPLADPEAVAAIREDLGLNQSIVSQYWQFITNAVQGDFGRSFISREPTIDAISRRLTPTLLLVGGSMALAFVGGVGLGIVAARRHNTVVDYAATGLAALGLSVPAFWLGLMLIFLVSTKWGLLPSIGLTSFETAILPIVTNSLLPLALIARMTRTSMLEVAQQDYVQTARAMGLRQRRITFIYALKNAMIPVATVVGVGLGIMLAASVVVEVVFSIQGVGRLLVTSIIARDFPVVQATVLLLGVAFILINLVLDIVYGMLDPRVRVT